MGLLCNFCGKDQEDVDTLICGPAVYICNECVDLCAEIIRDIRSERTIQRTKEMIFSELYGTD